MIIDRLWWNPIPSLLFALTELHHDTKPSSLAPSSWCIYEYLWYIRWCAIDVGSYLKRSFQGRWLHLNILIRWTQIVFIRSVPKLSVSKYVDKIIATWWYIRYASLNALAFVRMMACRLFGADLLPVRKHRVCLILRTSVSEIRIRFNSCPLPRVYIWHIALHTVYPSQCTQFVVLYFEEAVLQDFVRVVWFIDPYSSELLHCHWGNIDQPLWNG